MSIYLGLDSSTQSLSAILIDVSTGEVLANETVQYGRDLPEYNCPNGVLANEDPLIHHTDPLMWLAALDMLLARMESEDLPLGRIDAISGSGQQHGSVYLNAGADGILASLSPETSLAEQIAPALARETAPIWMDSSTSRQCAEITEAIGDRLQADTGSPAVERFTGPQVRKFHQEEPGLYDQTATIHLVSSFLCSVLCGSHAPIDYGDGAGMNLLNLKTLDWDATICAATAPDLRGKLPAVQPSWVQAGRLAQYFKRYGLRPGIPIIAWSGDNPNSLIGTGTVAPGNAVVSLGTSDTFFGAMEQPVVDPNGYGHVFGNPAGGFMSLICFKNGSLARERIKDELGVDWTFFDVTAFEKTPPGNDGNLMLPYFEAEITPRVLTPGIRRTGDAAFCAGEAPPETTIRAVVESQALSLRLHSEWMGCDFETLRVTGGASKSPGLCQVLADVFQASVEKISVANSAGLGAALRAANAEGGHGWDYLAETFCASGQTVEPRPEFAETYNRALERYRAMEKSALDS